jgi:hypothetical protein
MTGSLNTRIYLALLSMASENSVDSILVLYRLQRTMVLAVSRKLTGSGIDLEAHHMTQRKRYHDVGLPYLFRYRIPALTEMPSSLVLSIRSCRAGRC